MKKLTKKDYFQSAINHFNSMDEGYVLNVAKEQEITVEMMVKMLENEVNLLEKKNSGGTSGKMTEKQKENETYKQAILDFMEEEKGYTVTDLIKNVPILNGMSQQKVSAIVRLMKENDHTLKKEMIKRVSYFFLNDEE